MSSRHPIFDHIKDGSGRDQPTEPQPTEAVESGDQADASQPEQSKPAPIPESTPPPGLETAPASKPAALQDTPANEATSTPSPPAQKVKADRTHERLLNAAYRRWLRGEPQNRLRASVDDDEDGRLVDLLTASPGLFAKPESTFARLRWGGLLLYTGSSEQQAKQFAATYDNSEAFTLEKPVTPIRGKRFGLALPGIGKRGYAFLARKTRLIQPGDFTERFTYDVELTPCPIGPNAPEGYRVTKRIPVYGELVQRLRKKFSDADPADLSKHAHKLIDHIFPTFLTREAAMLGILQKNLDPAFRGRVPKPLGIEKDERGFVRTLHMNWMRVGGEPISQLDFAIQSAELLNALHEQARIMHLDLRMDNMVITPDGVGFVDFGSACRIGEKVEQSPMLDALFTEMMRTSQIQRMLGKMIERGHVTNNAIAEVYGKVDKTVDAFYLAVQIAKPHGNPELKQLIEFKPESETASMLSALTAAVLRPKNPEMAQYKTAGDLVRGLRRIERRAAKAAAKGRA